MAIKFNKRIKIAPGVKLNVGLGGVSTTIGARGASVNVGKKGVHANVGIAGTGLSSRTKIAGGSSTQEAPSNQTEQAPTPASQKLFMAIGVIVIVAFIVWLF